MKTSKAITMSLFILGISGPVFAQTSEPQSEPEMAHESHQDAQHQTEQAHHHHDQGVAIPIGVMGSHMHRAGEWMISASLMGSGMGGLLNQTQLISRDQALNDYAMAPESMWMGMPMLGVMYAPSDWLTLMAMVPGMGMRMSHVGHEAHMHTMQATATTPATMQSGGLGDVSLTAMLGNWHYQNHALHLNLGLSLPTGQIDLSQPSLNGNAPEIMPYMMRLGSGTWDLLPALTYTGHTGSWCWGLQPGGTIRLGTNSLNYKLGHRFGGSGWLGYRFNDWLSTSLRVQGQVWGNAEGADARLDKAMIPAADPAKLGGQRLDLLIGFNFIPWRGQRLGIEGGIPVYQSLSGPQMATQWLLQAGWQMGF